MEQQTNGWSTTNSSITNIPFKCGATNQWMIYYEFIHYKHFLDKNKGIPVGISILINKFQMKILIYPQFKDAHEMWSNTPKSCGLQRFHQMHFAKSEMRIKKNFLLEFLFLSLSRTQIGFEIKHKGMDKTVWNLSNYC